MPILVSQCPCSSAVQVPLQDDVLRCSITPLVSFTWGAETKSHLLSCPLHLWRGFAEVLLVTPGADSQHRTLHFSGLHGGLWMNFFKMDDLLGFKLPELLFVLSYENRWWCYFYWHHVAVIFLWFPQRTEVCRPPSCVIAETFSQIREKYMVVK